MVKILWDLSTDRLYFCDSARWPLHFDFAKRFIERPERPLGDRRAFNRRHYLRADREFILASLVRYMDAEIWALELGPADTLSGSRVVELMRRLRGSLFAADRLRYHPRSERHLDRIREHREQARVIEGSELFRGVRYQPLTLGVAYGRLRVFEGDFDPAQVGPDQIVLTRDVPDDMPLVAGLITSRLQAPLAHVAVLSEGRGTPNMASLEASEEERFLALRGQLVRLEVGRRAFSFRAATVSEVERASAERAARAPLIPALDPEVAAIRPVAELRLGDVHAYGAKAAQLGEVASLRPPVPTPGGFAVPVRYYLEHLRRGEIEASAELLRRSPGFASSGPARARRLASLRRQIAEAPLDPALLRQVMQRIAALPSGRLIVRSSTNAEDLPGFSGAGLYLSEIVPASPSGEQVAAALRRVWASVYTLRAFDEREHGRVDHDRVAMALLIQPLVPDLIALGVAITENPFSEQRSGMLVNMQARGGSVTATSAEVPEQILLYRHSRPEILTRSSRAGARPLFRASELRPLRDLLERIHVHFLPLWGERADAADIELALTEGRRVVILQARPYRRRGASPDHGTDR